MEMRLSAWIVLAWIVLALYTAIHVKFIGGGHLAAFSSFAYYYDTAHSTALQQQEQQQQGHGVILTSYFFFSPDPRTRASNNAHPKGPTFETIYHTWTSAVHNKLQTIIFHDRHAFDQEFVQKYTHPWITFVQVEDPANEKDTNPNDFRFGVFHQYLKEHGNQYKWYLIADMDMLFNRDPFVKLDYYEEKDNQNFFGSFDGGNWKQMAQGLQFQQCYGEELTSTFRPQVEWKTPNGNCGLWAGTYDRVRCVLQCMEEQYAKPPVQGKGADMPCDMAVHDYCVFFGGCFPDTTKGNYSTMLPEVRWGKDTQGETKDLFGPTFHETKDPKACIKDSWTVSHYRCGKRQRSPICFNHTTIGTYYDGRDDVDEDVDVDVGPLLKYLQKGYPNEKRCNLDNQTGLPLPNKK